MPDKILSEADYDKVMLGMNKLVLALDEIAQCLNTAIGIMDEKGRYNPEHNSLMLWESEWNQVRGILLELHDAIKEAK